MKEAIILLFLCSVLVGCNYYESNEDALERYYYDKTSMDVSLKLVDEVNSAMVYW
ncbi:hypothetical protein ACERJO_14470 [Halalkalibacter sp. AB-rgal2]|nr:hypothetical protein [Halalkalibacter sp. APA_J-10(15)]